MEELHFCQRCNRRLKSAKAIQDGMGVVCKRKDQADKIQAQAQQDKSNSKPL